LKAIPAIEATDLVRGQFKGYLDEKGVAPDSKTETYAALKLWVKSWRWDGVPFYIRAGKDMPVTCTEILARLKPAPATNFIAAGSPQNYVRMRISPEMTIALAVSVASLPEGGPRREVELVATRNAKPDEMEAYERVLTDAMAGDPTNFARQDYVEEAWRIVDPVLKADTPVTVYEPKTWGPEGSVVPPGGWDMPKPEGAEDFRLVQ
jgi:glucose-6-phosphate 1-dehydrogenase